jgi:hypothetical protein
MTHSRPFNEVAAASSGQESCLIGAFLARYGVHYGATLHDAAEGRGNMIFPRYDETLSRSRAGCGRVPARKVEENFFPD